MRRFRISIRGLMLATLIVGFDVAVLARFRKHDLFGDDGGILIGVLLASLNVLPFAYAWIIAKLARTPQEDQSPWILSLGCLLAAVLVLAAPILVVLSLN
jgi:hypothetical protein